MLIVGLSADKRHAVCDLPSWAVAIPSSPEALDQPTNSIWADGELVGSMLAMGDSRALSQFDAYPAQSLPEHWTCIDFA
jgi:hypothetical protein